MLMNVVLVKCKPQVWQHCKLIDLSLPARQAVTLPPSYEIPTIAARKLARSILPSSRQNRNHVYRLGFERQQ
jgi:hypothetical protein